MLQKIPGIEPAHLKNVKDQTSKQVVRGTQEIRVTEEEREKREREWVLPRDREKLAQLLEEINEEMEESGHPLRFALTFIDEKWQLEVWDIEEKKTLQFISIAEATRFFGKNTKRKGFLLDGQF